MKRKTHEQYVQEVKTKYGSHIKVVGTYLKSTEKLEHRCTKHNVSFSRYPTLMGPSGCIKCSRESGTRCKILPTDFAKLIKAISPHLSVRDYIRSDAKVNVTCRKHKVKFEAWPMNLRKGSGCPERAKEKVLPFLIGKRKSEMTNAEFKKFIKDKHGDSVKLVSKFTTKRSPITYKVVACGCVIERKTCLSLIHFTKCPSCSIKNRSRRSSYSKIAIKWIEETAKQLRLKNVEHAENGGEVRIPGTKFWADGYHERTKTVFEFYGDAYHGNPKLYKSNDTPNHYRPTLTAGEMYSYTRKREKLLTKLGYKVISVWESDYKRSIHQ